MVSENRLNQEKKERFLDEEQRNQLILQYIPLAKSLARRATMLPREDAIQEAMVGLIKAANRFDSSRNIAFHHYAQIWIRESLQLASIRELPVHVPVNVAKSAHAKRKTELVNQPGPSTIPPEHLDCVLFAETDAPKENRKKSRREITQAFAQSNLHPQRLSMENSDGEEILAFIPKAFPWADTETTLDAEKIRQHLHTLPQKQRQAIQCYFGSSERDGTTLEEVGKHMGISREGARQLIERGMDALRDSMRPVPSAKTA